MNTSYTEQRGFEPFNWFEELSKEEKDIDWIDLRARSSYWVTCAVGNLCSRIPRTITDRPINQQLDSLGISFNTAILEGDKTKALSILGKIERKSAEILAELDNF